jgi:hypothetical protein
MVVGLLGWLVVGWCFVGWVEHVHLYVYEIQSSKYFEISFLSYLLWKKELCLSQMSQKRVSLKQIKVIT